LRDLSNHLSRVSQLHTATRNACNGLATADLVLSCELKATVFELGHSAGTRCEALNDGSRIACETGSCCG